MSLLYAHYPNFFILLFQQSSQVFFIMGKYEKKIKSTNTVFAHYLKFCSAKLNDV